VFTVGVSRNCEDNEGGSSTPSYTDGHRSNLLPLEILVLFLLTHDSMLNTFSAKSASRFVVCPGLGTRSLLVIQRSTRRVGNLDRQTIIEVFSISAAKDENRWWLERDQDYSVAHWKNVGVCLLNALRQASFVALGLIRHGRPLHVHFSFDFLLAVISSLLYNHGTTNRCRLHTYTLHEYRARISLFLSRS
jgi:hypothetical protein